MSEEEAPPPLVDRAERKAFKEKLARLDEEFEKACNAYTKAFSKTKRAFKRLDDLDKKCARLWKRIAALAHALGVERKANRY